MITIVVPVYMVEEYLARCVDSILNQTYTNWQLLLVDDGSPDNCPTLCEKYAEEDSRIFVIHQKNGGLSAARNTGLNWFYEQNNSDFITFVDSDDWLHPQYLEILMKPVIENAVKISIGGFDRPEKELSDIITYENTNYEIITPEDLLLEHPWNYNYAWCKLYNKSVFEDVRYPVGKNFEDTFTTWKTLFKCNNVAFSNIVLYHYFSNEKGISHSAWTPKEMVIFDAMREQLAFYKENGYERAYEKEEELYLNHFAYQVDRIKANKKDLKKNKNTLRKIRKELRVLLKENKSKYPVHKKRYCYKAAYPLLMKIYSLKDILKLKEIIRMKIKNRGNKNEHS